MKNKTFRKEDLFDIIKKSDEKNKVRIPTFEKFCDWGHYDNFIKDLIKRYSKKHVG